MKKNMVSMYSYKFILFIYVFPVFLSGCKTTGLRNVEVDLSLQEKSYKKILIIGMTPKAHLRRLFETRFSESFTEEGIEAIPSYELIPEIKEVTKKNVQALIKGKDFDGVLVTRSLQKGLETKIIPKHESSGMGSFAETLDYYFEHYYQDLGEEYLVEFQWAVLENRLFESKEGELIWSASTKPFDVNSNDLSSIIHFLTEKVIKNLKKNGIIQ